ncbi:hypothetical protein [Streptomyces sp. WZ.A104]|uniref:hypothetical protein n=1 Tax=Streptomyces sp. WZ.A104 TaxID=2023771 RepID=UPI00211CC718|nr:hypothetical protein [Streptomyces sp. WZ.A104]
MAGDDTEMSDVLQCTAVTPAPPYLTHHLHLPCLSHLSYLLCELGEHDQRTEHAARLGAAETPDAPAPWFFWTGTGPERVHRAEAVPWCPAVLRHLGTGVVRRCTFFDHHTSPHSWGVTDPLGDLIAEGLVSGEDPKGWAQP